MEYLTIIVVDDHPLFRQGVVNALLLEEGVKVLGQAGTGEDAIELVRRMRPDVAIVDINLPGMNGLQVAHQLTSERSPTRVMLLTAYDDQEQIIHASWAGAAGYCSKDISPDQLVLAVREVAAGNYFIRDKALPPGEFTAWLERQMTQTNHSYSEPGSPFHPLSAREMEVLSCVVEGMSNKEIAVFLKISHQTVKNHVTSILRKFNVEDRTQAVVYALKHGWVKLTGLEKNSQE